MDLLRFTELPTVCLISGLQSQDSMDSLVKSLISRFQVSIVDFLNFPALTVESAQVIHNFAEVEPLGDLKLITINMAKAHVRAQNALLTLLEDPPERLKFILFDDSCVIDTIRSRAYTFNQVEDRQISKQSKSVVLSVLKAASELNDILLEDLFKNWDDEATELLLEWAVESLIKFPKVFTIEELSLYFPPGFNSNIITALSTVGAARGRLSVKSVMLSYVERSKGVR